MIKPNFDILITNRSISPCDIAHQLIDNMLILHPSIIFCHSFKVKESVFLMLTVFKFHQLFHIASETSFSTFAT